MEIATKYNMEDAETRCSELNGQIEQNRKDV